MYPSLVATCQHMMSHIAWWYSFLILPCCSSAVWATIGTVFLLQAAGFCRQWVVFEQPVVSRTLSFRYCWLGNVTLTRFVKSSAASISKSRVLVYLGVITLLVSYQPVYQAGASITARGVAEGSCRPRAWYKANMKTAVWWNRLHILPKQSCLLLPTSQVTDWDTASWIWRPTAK